MLVLFETPAGYALFKVLDEGKLENPDKLHKYFETPEAAQKLVSLKSFMKFEDITEAMAGATALVESKLSKPLKKFLKSSIVDKNLKDKLAIADAKLGSNIKSKLGINCVHDQTAITELLRGIRQQIEHLVTGLAEGELKNMALGLSHSLGRYKLKFSPDKVDIMIVQAISLLDDLDKELNTYAMRSREWYGWHFPELSKLIPDNVLFAKLVKKLGYRTNAAQTDLSETLPEELAKDVRDAAQISMGTEISQEDIENIMDLCDQVISISEYREQLSEYLKNRMHAIAPNLTVLVGEIVGARLIAHAGSLLNLAKYPASTVQILGAEKALFRALKTKHETPKYGLIYHASLIGQTAPKNKGKISRLLAAKTSLSARVDALGDKDTPEVGTENRAKVESRIRQLEGKLLHAVSGTARRDSKGGKPDRYDPKKHADNQQLARAGTGAYNPAADTTVAKPKDNGEAASSGKKDKKEKKEKKEKKDKKRKTDDGSEKSEDKSEKKDKKKRKAEDGEDKAEKKKKKKKKDKNSE